jgi:hypothetical protein
MEPFLNESEDSRERMQRVRVGLTGLAVVLLIVVLATVVFTRINGEVRGNQTASQKEGNEPLSDFGMAPRAPDDRTLDNSIAEKPQAKPAPR